MAATEWLLIGGPADGKKVTVLHGETVKWAGDNGEDWMYQGQNYLHRGRLFRIGVLDPNDAVPSKVARMIDESGLLCEPPRCDECDYCFPDEIRNGDDYSWKHYCNLAERGGKAIEIDVRECCPDWCPLLLPNA